MAVEETTRIRIGTLTREDKNRRTTDFKVPREQEVILPTYLPLLAPLADSALLATQTESVFFARDIRGHCFYIMHLFN